MKDDWAEEKVRVFYPACKEKVTLHAIAHYANQGGDGVWCHMSALAKDIGLSVRAVRRHVRTLVLRGDLVTWCDSKRSREGNFYYIPMCQESASELEARTGISVRQMRLPLVQRDHAGGLPPIGARHVPPPGTICPTPRVKMTYKNIPMNKPLNKKKSFSEGKLPEGVSIAKNGREQYHRKASEGCSPEMAEEIAKLLAKMEVETAIHEPAVRGAGTRLRERLLGEG